MGKTTRFGLQFFGGSRGGAITDDGSQFSLADRITLDTILAAYETHSHKGGVLCPNPTEPALVSVLTTGGQLRPGTTFYYRTSFVDAYGLESAAGPEASLTTAAVLTPPSQPLLNSQAGGILRPGTYYYGLTQISSDGHETPIGPIAPVTLDLNTGTVQLKLPPGRTVGGVTTPPVYNIWRLDPNVISIYVKVAAGVTAATFTDDGRVSASDPDDPTPEADPSQQPPTSNLTSSTNSAVITTGNVSLVNVDVGPIKRWRIYRTTQSGTYAPASMIGEVNGTLNADGSGGLVLTFTDVGGGGLPGKPRDASQCLAPSVKIVSAGGGAGAFVLHSRDTSSAVQWRVLCDDAGVLVTVRAPGAPVPLASDVLSDSFLTSPNGTYWRFTTNDNGALLTRVSVPKPSDTVFLPGAGPLLPSPSRFIDFVLDVANDGALVTYPLNYSIDTPQFNSAGPIPATGPAGPA